MSQTPSYRDAATSGEGPGGHTEQRQGSAWDLVLPGSGVGETGIACPSIAPPGPCSASQGTQMSSLPVPPTATTRLPGPLGDLELP